uniref:Cytochrome c oxidase subunit 7A2, mitochondrial n=1 Tax=Salmo salar TaxID=8030 RepID=B5XAH3_SALSA|nr:Cytochrome c oxidase polypeptide VIIa-liver/heart, mitochondrial precursor [Salmo salar]
MLILHVAVHDMSLIQYVFLHQEDNGIPVHLKGGVSDAILYRATMALTILGSAYVVYELVCAAFPKKKE